MRKGDIMKGNMTSIILHISNNYLLCMWKVSSDSSVAFIYIPGPNSSQKGQTEKDGGLFCLLNTALFINCF